MIWNTICNRNRKLEISTAPTKSSRGNQLIQVFLIKTKSIGRGSRSRELCRQADRRLLKGGCKKSRSLMQMVFRVELRWRREASGIGFVKKQCFHWNFQWKTCREAARGEVPMSRIGQIFLAILAGGGWTVNIWHRPEGWEDWSVL